MRYLVRSKLSRATVSSGPILAGRIDSNRAMSEPYLRNLVEKPAYGPNRSECLPPMTRVSRWGTDIGGEPTEVLHLDAPAPARLAADVGDAMRIVDRKPLHAREVANEAAGERSIVDVGAGDDPR